MTYQSQSLLVKNSPSLRPKYILHSRNDNDLIQESFVDQCLTRANERNIRPFEGAWYNSKRPHFSGVVLSPRRHKRYNSQNLYWHVIFNLGGMKNAQTIPGISARRRQKWVSKGIWFCDGRPASLVGKGCPNGETLVIICPQTEHDVQPGLVNVRNITYYIGDHIDCFLTRTFRRPNVSGATAANAFLFGESMKYPRRMIEWVEYHRMIGVDHFFIYYMGNYSSDEGFLMPNFPYLTYLPYNLMDESNFFDLTKSFRFQKTQQMDAIYRARGLGYSWMLMLDIDEYIQFGNMSLKLPEYLTDCLQIHRKTGNPNIGGISIQSTSFGAAHGEPRFPDLMIDHIWKRQTMFVGERQKSIVRPNHVDYYAIHGVTSGDFEVHAEPNIIRIAHYRRPELGVFLASLPKRDSSFRDFWHDKLKAKLDVVWSQMKDKYSSRDEVWSTNISFTFFDENKTRKMYSNA
jgi:Glycosyltransferase family 92